MNFRNGILIFAAALSACVAPVRSHSVTPQGADSCVAAASLIERIDALDQTAISVALNSVRCFDGGEVEDLYRSLGAAFSKEPALVSEQVVASNVRAEYVVPMMTMLPLTYVDDPCGSADELEHRRTLISDSTMPDKMKEVLSSAVSQSLDRDRLQCLAASQSAEG